MYHVYLIIESIEHSRTVFEQYLYEDSREICLDNGNIRDVDGMIACSVDLLVIMLKMRMKVMRMFNSCNLFNN